MIGNPVQANQGASQQLFTTLAEVTRLDPPASDGLERLCGLLAEMLGALGVMVSALDEHRRPWLHAGSPGEYQRIGRAQFQLGQGPCVEASQHGQAVWARCETAAARWPLWAPQAVEAGIDGVVSLPVVVDGGQRPPSGTLWMAFHRSGWQEDGMLRAASAVATVTINYLSCHRELGERREEVSQLQRALDSRVTIEQAKGYVAAREHVSPDEAFERLRRVARSSQRPLREVAAGVLQGDTALFA